MTDGEVLDVDQAVLLAAMHFVARYRQNPEAYVAVLPIALQIPLFELDRTVQARKKVRGLI